MFDRILVANRGEIAVRVARTCREIGVECVAVYSDVDADARHVRAATVSVHLPGVVPEDTYLNASAIVEAALATGARAIHPGYGFLAENADFAAAVIEAGLAWVGPPPDAIRAAGDKIAARRIATDAGVPVVPGLLEPVISADVVAEFGEEQGWPVAIKAAGGGGGRGLKVARGLAEVSNAFRSARRESVAYFGSDEVYVERYLEAPKHLEVQLLAPNPDEALWLGVRDCSLQRRHQKLVEETPPPRWGEHVEAMGAAAVALSKACGYVNAGTVEMLVDRDGAFYFLEVNSRLQVEHTVTEAVFGVDLVACQLAVAAGDELGLSQAGLSPRGHAVECRINAEDPARGFLPAPGRIERYEEPGGPGVRVDSGYGAGDDIPDAYDSLVAKVVTWGEDREQSLERMRRALEGFVIEGVATTIPAHLLLLDHPDFRAGTHTTGTIGAGALDALAEPPAGGLVIGGEVVRLWHPAMAASATGAQKTHARGELLAPMQGTVLEVLVGPGQRVGAGDPLLVIEAMKMETTLAAPHDGVVVEMRAVPGRAAGAGEILAIIR